MPKILLFLLPLALIALAMILIVRNNSIPEDIGVRDGRLAPLPASPNAVSSQTENFDQKVAPLPFLGDLEQTRKRLLKVIGSYPGNVQIISETATYIHCVFTTARMGFKDDVEFYLDTGNSLIHIRSASRIGYSDMGMNRNRYDTLAASYLRGN